jgi:hypothetical protein
MKRVAPTLGQIGVSGPTALVTPGLANVKTPAGAATRYAQVDWAAAGQPFSLYGYELLWYGFGVNPRVATIIA